MSESVILKSSSSAATLEFRRVGADDVAIHITRPELFATVTVCDWDQYWSMKPIVEFLDTLARDWRGWEGERSWASLEGDFSLVCTADRLGHVALRVKLQNYSVAEPWSVETQIDTEPAQIEIMARAMRARLFS